MDGPAEIYHFFTDEAHHAQGEFLEFIVIALILIEVVLGIAALVVDILYWHEVDVQMTKLHPPALLQAPACP